MASRSAATTGLPAILWHPVVTLHPKVHGADIAEDMCRRFLTNPVIEDAAISVEAAVDVHTSDGGPVVGICNGFQACAAGIGGHPAQRVHHGGPGRWR